MNKSRAAYGLSLLILATGLVSPPARADESYVYTSREELITGRARLNICSHTAGSDIDTDHCEAVGNSGGYRIADLNRASIALRDEARNRIDGAIVDAARVDGAFAGIGGLFFGGVNPFLKSMKHRPAGERMRGARIAAIMGSGIGAVLGSIPALLIYTYQDSSGQYSFKAQSTLADRNIETKVSIEDYRNLLSESLGRVELREGGSKSRLSDSLLKDLGDESADEKTEPSSRGATLAQ